jgi:hypothetical protein
MDRFTMDNTEGYTEEELDALNEMFEDQMDEEAEHLELCRMEGTLKSYVDYVAESLLARYSCAEDFSPAQRRKFHIQEA